MIHIVLLNLTQLNFIVESVSRCMFVTNDCVVQPLRVTGIDSSMVASIERVLQGKTEQLENELRALFHSPLHCISSDVNELLRDYRNQRQIGTFIHCIAYIGCQTIIT